MFFFKYVGMPTSVIELSHRFSYMYIRETKSKIKMVLRVVLIKDLIHVRGGGGNMQ